MSSWVVVTLTSAGVDNNAFLLTSMMNPFNWLTITGLLVPIFVCRYGDDKIGRLITTKGVSGYYKTRRLYFFTEAAVVFPLTVRPKTI